MDQEYKLFKGLQKPLEFMGIQGRYIAWAGIGLLVNLVSFVVVFSFFSSSFAIPFLLVTSMGTVGYIAYKQNKGLYSKKTHKGVFIVNKIFP